MPLSAPADREPLHACDLIMRGYRRADGLYDIEGHLTDTKTAGFESMDAAASSPASRCTACGCA
jgi:hypothetical protein